MSAYPNPFKLQTDDKKFFFEVANHSALQSQPIVDTSVRRIKNINEQLQQLARKKQEMLFKDSQLDYVFKKEKPSMQLNDFITGINKDKKFRVRALLKEKKESIHQFLAKKKEIYLSKMNINTKKEQTAKLEDSIKDQEQTLKSRRLFFENDVQFMQKFIEGVKKSAEQAQSTVEQQLKIQETLVSKLNSIQAETEKIDNLIAKQTQILRDYKTYKDFIDSFVDPAHPKKQYFRKLKLQNELAAFVTQNQETVNQQNLGCIIMLQPADLRDIFNNAEENNIREIQNLHDKEDQMEAVRKKFFKEEMQFEKMKQQNILRISTLQKCYQKKLSSCNRLKDMKKNNKNKFNILDNQNIDLQKVNGKIMQIHRQINSKNQIEDGEKIMRKAMTEIEQEIQKLRAFLKKEKQLHPQKMSEIQKQIKENQKQQNLARKREEDKERELKKLNQQEKKRNEPVSETIRGRRDMGKVLLDKKVRTKEQINVKTVDQSQKYFTND